MRKKWWRGMWLIAIVALLGAVILAKSFAKVSADDWKTETAIPKMYISLNGATLEEINSGSKEIKYVGNGVVLDVDDEKTYFENVEIKGRGNSTWAAEKKPYQIKFSDKVDLLGMGRERKWVLISGYLDHSLLRTDLAFYLAKQINSSYQLDGKFMELYVDNDYIGLYYMAKAVNVDKNVVDLRDPMGILVEVDNVYCMEEDLAYTTRMGDCLTVKDLVTEDNLGGAMDGFIKDYEKLEKAAENADYNTIDSVADIDSLAEYYLISELTGNLDAYVTSFYFYKDGPNDKIHAGPAWDFDGAFGNVKWQGVINDGIIYAPETLEARRPQAFSDDENAGTLVSKIMYNLSVIPEFQNATCKIYNDKIFAGKVSIMTYLRETAAKIKSAAIMNNAKWHSDNYDESVEYLIDWVSRRFDALERVCLPRFDGVTV